ncbi:putative sporulation protein YtxC [Litchfieldia alkalitelluris]|uniref:putative sporulation protein YtxC n=1 Tax=Litchfieldia alkalitelluris TaxID=304268 RepID=UPI00147523FC|nr:putative sporulation protein YtxC [Litchfieldia alkalitelluris]
MIEISFQDAKEAKALYERLNKQKNALSINYIQITYNQDVENKVRVAIKKKKEIAIQTALIPVLVQFVLDRVEDAWILSIIENEFYFSDIEEQNQILTIAHSLINGQYEELPEAKEIKSRKETLRVALDSFIHSTISFSFESFLKFRLRDYSQILLKYTEMAIDEYKLEQEYQNFIQNLRDYTVNRTPKIERLHILHDDQFFFYNESLNELKYSEITKHIDRKLIMNHPMYIDSNVIAPLVSIAPKSIAIYTNEIDHGMVQTIQNIFLERVHIYSKGYFENVKLQQKI